MIKGHLRVTRWHLHNINHSLAMVAVVVAHPLTHISPLISSTPLLNHIKQINRTVNSHNRRTVNQRSHCTIINLNNTDPNTHSQVKALTNKLRGFGLLAYKGCVTIHVSFSWFELVFTCNSFTYNVTRIGIRLSGACGIRMVVCI